MFEIIKSFPLTFYSAPFYRRLAREGRGLGFGFLLLATFLSAINFFVNTPFAPVLDQRKELFDQLPAITIHNGELSMEAPAPQTFNLLADVQGGPVRIVIDPDADTNDLEKLKGRMAADNILIFVSKSRLVLYDKAGDKTEVTEIKEIGNKTFTHEDWVQIGEQVDNLIVPVLFFTFLGGSFFSHVVSALGGALLLLAAAPLFRIPLAFKPCVRIAAAAKVPVASISLLVSPHLVLQGLIWFGFAAFGLLAQRDAKAVGK